MKYWKDFQSKWGFEDGDAVPNDADFAREVCIKAVNLVGIKFKSRVRAVAYNCGGVHNPVMIGFVSRVNLMAHEKTYWQHSDGGLNIEGRNVILIEPDMAMKEAITFCQEQKIEWWVSPLVDIVAELRKMSKIVNTRIRQYHQAGLAELKSKK